MRRLTVSIDVDDHGNDYTAAELQEYLYWQLDPAVDIPSHELAVDPSALDVNRLRVLEVAELREEES